MEITVIIPVLSWTSRLYEVRKNLARSSFPVQVVLVLDPLTSVLKNKELPNEIKVRSSRRGRGHALVAGLAQCKTDFALFLHSDTLLPPDWFTKIERTMSDQSIAGGGFSLTFDQSNSFLKFLIFLADIFFHVFKELWGDRAIFFRTQMVDDELKKLDIPIMEDVMLSSILRSKGELIILRERVITSSNSFLRSNMFIHTFKIIVCRAWYFFGGKPERIYSYYYSNTSKIE